MIDSAKIVNHGMINIPASIRKALNLKDGDKVWVELGIDGTIHLIPIRPLEELRKESYTVEEMIEEMDQSRKIELELEK